MPAHLAKAILGLALLPLAGLAQIGSDELRPGALWQIQQADMQPRAGGSYLGIQLADLDAERARTFKLTEIHGVEVKIVQAGSPAERAGIQVGDVLLSYNGENVLGAQQLVRLVQETPPGRKIKLQVWRDGKERTTFITTGGPPRNDSNGPVVGFGFSDGSVYRLQAPTIIPRPILVWRDISLGIEFEELDAQLSEYFGVPGGVLIRGLEKGSPAEKLGIKAGDVIISARHKPIATAHDFTSCLRTAGSPAAITLVRNHKKIDLNLPWPASDQ